MNKVAERLHINAASGAMTLLAVIVFTSCIQNSTREIQVVEQQEEGASLIVKDVHTCITDSGFYKYEFETPELLHYEHVEEPYVDFPKGIKFKALDNHGKTQKTFIRCNDAKYYKEANLWELNHDVQAITEKNDILNTEQLFWDNKEHRIYSDKFVKITTKNQVITGFGFESDEKMSYYEIKRPGGELELESKDEE